MMLVSSPPEYASTARPTGRFDTVMIVYLP